MKDLKLTLYDWLGYLIPGTILVLSVYFTVKDTEVFQKFNIEIDSGFINGFVFFCIAYLSGHIIHSIANFTIDLLPYGGYAPNKYFKDRFLKDFNQTQIKSICDLLKTKFNLEFTEKNEEFIKHNYWLCYTNVVENKPDSLSQTFLNLNGFYRGASVSTAIACLIFFIKSILTFGNDAYYIIGIILFLSSVLLYLRAKRFKIYLTRTVYTDFISLST